jgi:endonuclease I
MYKKLFYYLLFICFTSLAQPNNYYESSFGLVGDELKQELHNIIKNHTVFSYTTTKSILRESDEDPNNMENIILTYSGNSIDKFDFASSFEPDFWNREHVWPKSHGEFSAGDPFEVPAYSDVHNLKPADHSMNTYRGEKDFDNGGSVVFNGDIETDCLGTTSTFEPRDDVKGDIARIILYGDVRYEGGDGEPNLAIQDGLTTYPNPQIGVLSTLLEWHEMDPPSPFEKRRNDVIFKWQGNRNPFIDYPEFVDYIFSENPQTNPIEITNVSLNPENIEGGQNITISGSVLSMIDCAIVSVILNYGNNWGDITNNIVMTLNTNGEYECEIPEQPYNTMFCYTITATICEEISQSFVGSEVIPPFPFEGIITPISDIQGQVEFSPYDGQTVNTTGIVTGAFANSFYIQDGSEPWSGIYIYSGSGGVLPSMGDSVIVSGQISEFCWDGSSPCPCSQCGGAGVTEIDQPEDIYIISSNNLLPEPIIVNSGDALTEQYEGVLVRIENVECTGLANGFGVWQANDGTGSAGIHNTPDGYEYDPAIGEVYNITGIVTSTFNEWKIDLRIPSDVESGPDELPPFIQTHNCYQVGANYYVYLYFNEAVNPDFININNFIITNANIESVTLDAFDPTKIIISLNNVISTAMGLIIYEMSDLIGNTTTNITHSINCEWNFSIDDFQNLNNISIYPNPNNGQFQITLMESSNIIVTNSIGQIIFEKFIEKGINEITISKKAGLYFIKDDYNTQFIRLIIED